MSYKLKLFLNRDDENNPSIDGIIIKLMESGIKVTVLPTGGHSTLWIDDVRCEINIGSILCELQRIQNEVSNKKTIVAHIDLKSMKRVEYDY